jgi:hypothetical protein
MRATHAGFSLAYAPDAVVDHSALRGARAVAARSFRLGRGRAQTTRHGDGPARQRRRNWLPLRSYLPFAATGLADYVFVGLPLLAGYALGAVEARLGRGSVTSQPRSAKSLTRAARARRTRR